MYPKVLYRGAKTKTKISTLIGTNFLVKAPVVNASQEPMSQVVAAESIVCWTEVLPVIGRSERGCCIGVHCQDDRHARLQMEIYVAVEEPRAWVVRLQIRLISPRPYHREGGNVNSKRQERTVKRIVTLSPAVPVLTTSRRGGLW